MAKSSSIRQHEWPVIHDIDSVETDNIKALIERADALLKAQDDGLKAMESRMGSLFGQSITLASAAVAAAVTAFAAIHTQPGGPAPPLWALPWVAQSLAVLSAFWLAAVATAAASMLGQTWTTSGMQPRDPYKETLLTAPPNSLRLAIARSLQEALDRNTIRTTLYVRRLAWVVGLLATGPLTTAMTALWLARPPWMPLAYTATIVAANIWIVWSLYRRVAPYKQKRLLS